MADIVFCDVETTGLDPQRHTILELALIKGSEERVWWIEPTVGEQRVADTGALKVNHYWHRQSSASVQVMRHHHHVTIIPPPDEHSDDHDPSRPDRREEACNIAQFTAGCILAGNNVKFDQMFLETWLRRHGACPVWDYHVLDVPTFVAGVIHGRHPEEAVLPPPFKSSRISEMWGVPEPEGDDKHTALADAQWSKAMWEAVTS